MTGAQTKNMDQILAGEYALGLLIDEDKAAFEARLGAEPALRRYYTNWIEDFVSPVSYTHLTLPTRNCV